MNPYLSVKFKSVSFFLMILVVVIHAFNFEEKLIGPELFSHKGYAFFIEDFISNGLARVAVPIFFAISAYLFFINIKGDFGDFVSKAKKRFKTIFVPYVLWSCWGILFYFILQLVPQTKAFFTKKLIIQYTFSELLQTIFIDPIPYQLWFLRDLFILVLLAPLIYYFIKWLKWGAVFICLVLWLSWFDLHFISMESLNYFVFGGAIALLKPELINTRFSGKHLWLTGVWLVLLVLKAFGIQYGLDAYAGKVLYRLCILFGFFAAWSLYDVFFGTEDLSKKRYYFIFSFSFFLFATHEPILTIIKKVVFFILGKTELTILVSYLVTPLIVIPLCLTIGYLLNRILPRLYALLTGGR